MIVEQIYTGCLSQGAYYIESDGEAAIIDPLREVETYLKRAQQSGATIKYVLETHFHADFVSGHLDLAAKTGATIVYGPNAAPNFPTHIATDGEILNIGRLQLKVLHTPGHTLESVCYLLLDETDTPRYLFTGDTLFIGDVGRPDLAQKSTLSAQDLASMLYDSLNLKIKTLPDDVVIYPAHGAGSACGKKMAKETFDTLGHQKQVNYALLATSREAFVREVLDGLALPQYFPLNVALNKNGYMPFEKVLSNANRPLDADELEQVANRENALLLDTRDAVSFSCGHIPNSVNVGLNGQFAPWAGELISDLNQPILVIADPEKVQETITRLARVGFDNVLGYLEGGFSTWLGSKKPMETVERIDATHFEEIWNEKMTVLDLRRDGEFEAEHLENAVHRPLSDINQWSGQLDSEQPFVLYCGSGYRSMIAASMLKARGFHHFLEISGGFQAISRTKLPKTAFICPSKR